jgi:D-glycero-alpha-D-manno-heptose-7-phosphate kinase
MNYISKAPLRLSFAGGGTDLAPFRDTEGGCALSATINLYAIAELRRRKDKRVVIHADHLAGGFIDGAVQMLSEGRNGFDLRVQSPVGRCSGLGASSAIVVTLAGVFSPSDPRYDIAARSVVIEREGLSVPGGLLDHYSAAFGGFNFMTFSCQDVEVAQIQLGEPVIHELESNLLLCFTGNPHMTDDVIGDQIHRMETQENTEALRVQKYLAHQMRDYLLAGNLEAFGAGLEMAWLSKKGFSPKVSNDKIDELYLRAREAGALGGKITGAGGGGHMLFYCRPGTRQAVLEAVQTLGASEVPFKFEFGGLQVRREP